MFRDCVGRTYNVKTEPFYYVEKSENDVSKTILGITGMKITINGELTFGRFN